MFACEPPVTYDEPQPTDTDNLSKFPNRLQGQYASNERTLIKRDGDSLVTHIHYIDTLFQMSYDDVVRKFKGYYFLNSRYDKESWEVKKIQLSKGQLITSSISTKLDLENVKEITETTQDTIHPYKFTMTKRLFKKCIKNNGFSDSETFVRQKKNAL